MGATPSRALVLASVSTAVATACVYANQPKRRAKIPRVASRAQLWETQSLPRVGSGESEADSPAAPGSTFPGSPSSHFSRDKARTTSDNALLKAFNKMARGRSSGDLTALVLREDDFVYLCLKELKLELSRAEVIRLFERLDEEKTGTMQFEQFRRAVRHSPSQLDMPSPPSLPPSSS